MHFAFSAFEYTYLLFWNSFWTIAPVIAIGIFDRIVGMFNSPSVMWCTHGCLRRERSHGPS